MRFLKARRLADTFVRLSVAIAFSINLFLAAAWKWLSPQGFPLSHSRFWLNSIVPLIVIAFTLAGLIGLMSNKHRLAATAAVMLSVGWLAIGFTSRYLFPQSLRGFWLFAVFAALSLAGLAWQLRREVYHASLRWIPLMLLPVITGTFVVWAQVPPVPSTTPLQDSLPTLHSGSFKKPPQTFRLSENVHFSQLSTSLSMRHGNIELRCFPLIKFDRISPDGFWSLLAPPQKKRRPLVEYISDSEHHWFRYDEQAIIRFPVSQQIGEVRCDSWSCITKETYSHLNDFCALVIEGHRNLSIAFSPCQEIRIPITPADYPTGRPARFAYLNTDQTLNVVEARSGEKGPFRILAQGPLLKGEKLAILLFDGEKLITTWTLGDWSRQLSSDLSPSAGWKVPANAIQFRRSGDAKDSLVEIFITLAGTGIGRGWETVGHRAGVYRNKMSFMFGQADTESNTTP